MNFTRLINWTLCLTASYLLGCRDHPNPDITPGSTSARLRVKTITLQLPNNIAKVSAFRYDQQGRLRVIHTYQSPDSTVAEIENSVYLYDAQNRLVQLRREAILFPPSGQPNPVELYTYSYNAAGLPTELAYLNGFTLIFGYDNANRLIMSKRDWGYRNYVLRGTDTLTYTGNNVTRVGTNRFFTTNSPSVGTYTYDTKVNPFYGFFVIPAPYPAGFVNLERTLGGDVKTYFGGVDNLLNLSQNNVLSESETRRSTVTYQYEYNTANLPTVRRATTNGVLTETLLFAYEAY